MESVKIKILVLGGDGYLGWPTAINLSERGHNVAIVDNYIKRKILVESDRPALFDVPDLASRTNYWGHKSGKLIRFWIGDVADYKFLGRVFEEFEPEAVVHFAEQPSAPYSMWDYEKAKFTLANNLLSTLSLIHTVREHGNNTHIVKLGTMGEYGTPNIDIEEGFIDIEHKGRRDRLIFPRQAGSLYHTTKIQDTDLLFFYVRAWGLRVTDLMQGPVYGFETAEISGDSLLNTFFSYDDIFGTVFNRFIAQAVARVPLTVYGKGGQTRGYLNLRDTLQCIRLALEDPAEDGEMRIINQFTEIFSVLEIAKWIRDAGCRIGLNVKISHIANPRIEEELHYYNANHTHLNKLGLKPHLLSSDVIIEMMNKVLEHKSKIRKDMFLPSTQWV